VVSDFKAALQLNRNHGELRHALCVVYNNMGIDYTEKKVFDRAVRILEPRSNFPRMTLKQNAILSGWKRR